MEDGTENISNSCTIEKIVQEEHNFVECIEENIIIFAKVGISVGGTHYLCIIIKTIRMLKVKCVYLFAFTIGNKMKLEKFNLNVVL